MVKITLNRRLEAVVGRALAVVMLVLAGQALAETTCTEQLALLDKRLTEIRGLEEHYISSLKELRDEGAQACRSGDAAKAKRHIQATHSLLDAAIKMNEPEQVEAPGTRAEDSDSAEGYDRGADLRRLGEWVMLEQSLTLAKRDQAQHAIAEHLRNAIAFTEAEFYMEVRRIVGLADNGHSNVTNRPIYQTFGLIPLRAYWFSDGLYIVRARAPHERFLGARVDEINGTPISELETRLLDYHGGNIEHFRRYAAMPLMFSPPLLHALDLSESHSRMTLRLTREGEVMQAAFDVDHESSSVGGPPWRYLHPAPIDVDTGWSTIHDDTKQLPLFLREKNKRFRYLLIADGAVAYIQLRSNIGTAEHSARDFVARARGRLEDDRPRAIILDNRHNRGGDLGHTADFALALPSLVHPQGKVYVITDGATFSAGIYTSFYPRAANPERTVVVGEHVGDHTRFWAETGERFVLPDSGYGIGYALRMHDIGEGCQDREICHMTRGFDPRWNIAVGSLEPDWPVPTNFADFEAGRDRPLERILEDVARAAP